MNQKFRYSEIFGHTFQGEGKYAGVPTVWYRAWGCNFSCNGFGQKNPLDPSSWILDYKNIDISKYNKLEELPVFHTGCDSSYSWSKKFLHLANKETPEEITKKIRSYLTGGSFVHPTSKQHTHMAFTGGEPMLSQTAIIEIMKQFIIENDLPRFVTIETNGTQYPRNPFIEFFNDIQTHFNDFELFWSVSPKLYISGEKWDNAILPEVLHSYFNLSKYGQLKYVCDGSERCWDEVEQATNEYRKYGIDWPVYIMPVGADKEMQEEYQSKVAEEACKRGYNVAPRIHVHVFGNVLGK